jgi:cell division transport system permease protein
MMRALNYALQEALVSMRRGGRSAVISIITIAIAFLTLGAFLLLSANLQRVAEQWAAAAEMSVYLEDTIDDATRTALQAELQQHAAVAGVEVVSKEAALQRFTSDFPELADVATGANPFPASFEVRLRPEADAGEAAASLAATLTDRPGVADVRYDGQWIARLLEVVAAIRIGGVVVAAVLVLGAAFTVAAVVRLSLESRHAEVDIMQLVGAPSTFVRGPFVAEGTLLGALGATLSIVLLWGLYVALRGRVGAAMAGVVPVEAVRFLGFGDGLMVVAAGLVVGALAGTIASRVAR